MPRTIHKKINKKTFH